MIDHIVKAVLQPMDENTAKQIAQWEYPAPYEDYSFKGRDNKYLWNCTTWGVEQFCLMDGNILLGQVSCQYDGDDLWVGWSMAPSLCGRGNGARFVVQCLEELCRVKEHHARIMLRVAVRNQRAITAYQKAGFRYVRTIQDEIAYSNHFEDFWVMEYCSALDEK